MMKFAFALYQLILFVADVTRQKAARESLVAEESRDRVKEFRLPEPTEERGARANELSWRAHISTVPVVRPAFSCLEIPT